MGALILQEVIKDLIHLHGLATATKLYLAGTRQVIQVHREKKITELCRGPYYRTGSCIRQ